MTVTVVFGIVFPSGDAEPDGAKIHFDISPTI